MEANNRGRAVYTPTEATGSPPVLAETDTAARRRSRSRLSQQSRRRRRSASRRSPVSPRSPCQRSTGRAKSRSPIDSRHVSPSYKHPGSSRVSQPRSTGRQQSRLRRRSPSRKSPRLGVSSNEEHPEHSRATQPSSTGRMRTGKPGHEDSPGGWQSSKDPSQTQSRAGYRSRSPLKQPRANYAKGHQFAAPDKITGESTSSSEQPILSDLVNVLKSMSSNNLEKLGSLNNTIPEFDPSKKEQTMTMWLHKVNECATIYTWSERQTIHFALPKLKGIAQRWYEGLPSVLFTWAEWQEKLLSTFPSEENYGQMLSDMLAKRARFSDCLEEYYYDKLSLINRCGISGKRAVECILHGIDDRSVRLGAEAAQFDDPNKLLSYLRNARNTKLYNERRINKGQPQKSQNNPNPRPTRCSNCKKDGHVTSQCTQPLKKCTRCSRIGHEAEQCFARLPVTEEKKVMRIVDEADIYI